jgi:hypothetical protein
LQVNETEGTTVKEIVNAFLRAKTALFVSADLLPNRYWVRQKSLPKKMPNTPEQASRALADALSEYSRAEQGRGHRCTVETYLRCGRLHYFFAYLKDYSDTYIGHDLTE